MKFFSQVVGLFCILCISTAAGVINIYGLSLRLNAQAGLLESHHRHKRQIEFDQLRRCAGIIQDKQCNSGLGQASADLALRCGLLSVASSTQENCRRNSNGEYCSLAGTYITEVDNIGPACQTSLTGTCTPRCRNLLTLIRAELGCCINLVFNVSTNLLYRPTAFNNALWTNCGVDPVTEECTSSPIRLRDINFDPTCNIIGDAAELGCTSRFLEPIFDALMEDGNCQPYLDAVFEGCGVNELGERCSTQSNLFIQFSATQNACNSTTNDTCDEECMQTLTNFRDVGGCCVNNLFNGSLAGISVPSYEFLSFEFWSNCGVETVGVCKAKLNGATYLKAPGIATLLMMLTAYLASY